MDKPLVSVVMPVYGCAPFLRRAVESVLSQSERRLELVLVDDCSNDGGREIVREFEASDSRVRAIYFDTNRGAAAARNAAIESAKGRFIAFLDGDDQWLPDKLSRQIEYMLSENVHFTCTSFQAISEEGHALGGPNRPSSRIHYADLLKENVIGCLTAVYDTEFFGKVLMPDIRKRQDYGLWLRLLRRGGPAHCLDDVLALYTVRRNSVSSRKFGLIKYNWWLFRKIEGIGIFLSVYYLSYNVLRKLKRTLGRKFSNKNGGE